MDIISVKSISEEIRTTAAEHAISTIKSAIAVGEKVDMAKRSLNNGEIASLFDPESPNYVGFAKSKGYQFLKIFENQHYLTDGVVKQLPQDVLIVSDFLGLEEDEKEKALQSFSDNGMTQKDYRAFKKSLKEPDIQDAIVINPEEEFESEEIDPANETESFTIYKSDRETIFKGLLRLEADGDENARPLINDLKSQLL